MGASGLHPGKSCPTVASPRGLQGPQPAPSSSTQSGPSLQRESLTQSHPNLFAANLVVPHAYQSLSLQADGGSHAYAGCPNGRIHAGQLCANGTRHEGRWGQSRANERHREGRCAVAFQQRRSKHHQFARRHWFGFRGGVRAARGLVAVAFPDGGGERPCKAAVPTFTLVIPVFVVGGRASSPCRRLQVAT